MQTSSGSIQQAPGDFAKRFVEARTRYSNEDSLQIVGQFVTGELSVDQIVQRYQLSNRQISYIWVGRSIEETLQLSKNEEPPPANRRNFRSVQRN